MIKPLELVEHGNALHHGERLANDSTRISTFIWNKLAEHTGERHPHVDAAQHALCCTVSLSDALAVTLASAGKLASDGSHHCTSLFLAVITGQQQRPVLVLSEYLGEGCRFDERNRPRVLDDDGLDAVVSFLRQDFPQDARRQHLAQRPSRLSSVIVLDTATLAGNDELVP